VTNLQKPKIVLTVQEYQFGGASKQVFWIMQSLLKRGMDVVLITNARDTWLGQQIRESGLNFKVYYTSWIQRDFHLIKDLLSLFFIMSVLRKEKPDYLLLAGAKLIVQGSILGWLCRIPHRFAHLHGLGTYPKSPVYPIMLFMNRLSGKLGTTFITVSQDDYRTLLKHQVVPPAQVRTVYNGIEINKIQQGIKGRFRKQFHIPKDAFVVAMIARLASQKRCDDFIRIMVKLCQQYDHIYGCLVGDGILRVSLQKQIDQTGFSDRIFISGFIENMPDVYQDINLSVLMTHYEGLPITLCESAANGIPIIANPVCGNPEIVLHGVNGYLAENVDEAVNYARLLIHDEALRRQFGEHGKRIVYEHFDATKQTEYLLDTILLPEQQILMATEAYALDYSTPLNI